MLSMVHSYSNMGGCQSKLSRLVANFDILNDETSGILFTRTYLSNSICEVVVKVTRECVESILNESLKGPLPIPSITNIHEMSCRYG